MSYFQQTKKQQDHHHQSKPKLRKCQQVLKKKTRKQALTLVCALNTRLNRTKYLRKNGKSKTIL